MDVQCRDPLIEYGGVLCFCTLPPRLFKLPYLFQVPGGPAYKLLEPGDVLVRVNDGVSSLQKHDIFGLCFCSSGVI